MDDSKKVKPAFDFAAHEKPLMDDWYNKGYFHRTPGFGKYAQDTYTITIPPPNNIGFSSFVLYVYSTSY